MHPFSYEEGDPFPFMSGPSFKLKQYIVSWNSFYFISFISLQGKRPRKSKIDVERQAEKELVCKVGMNWESQEKDLENLTYGTENRV